MEGRQPPSVFHLCTCRGEASTHPRGLTIRVVHKSCRGKEEGGARDEGKPLGVRGAPGVRRGRQRSQLPSIKADYAASHTRHLLLHLPHTLSRASSPLISRHAPHLPYPRLPTHAIISHTSFPPSHSARLLDKRKLMAKQGTKLCNFSGWVLII